MNNVEKLYETKGESVFCINLEHTSGLACSVITYGAAIQTFSIASPGSLNRRKIVLGLKDAADYKDHSPHLGAIAGRFANRIRNGRFVLNGQSHELDCNENGLHHLHGGNEGFGRKNWNIGRVTKNELVLSLISPDGDQDYPGRAMVTCTYRLEQMALEVEMRADLFGQASPVNLAHHSYWNLDGGGSVDGHHLQVFADQILEKASDGVPNGVLLDVTGTEFDFRESKTLKAAGSVAMDHCFAVRGDGYRKAAVLKSSDGSVAMSLFADQPGVQVYTSDKLNVQTKNERLGPREGICLETQAFPDSPNQPDFPSAIIAPGMPYKHRMRHEFNLTDMPLYDPQR